MWSVVFLAAFAQNSFSLPLQMPHGFSVLRRRTIRTCTSSTACCKRDYGPWFLAALPSLAEHGNARNIDPDIRYAHVPIESLKAKIIHNRRASTFGWGWNKCVYTCQDTRDDMYANSETFPGSSLTNYQVREKPSILAPLGLGLSLGSEENENEYYPFQCPTGFLPKIVVNAATWVDTSLPEELQAHQLKQCECVDRATIVEETAQALGTDYLQNKRANEDDHLLLAIHLARSSYVKRSRGATQSSWLSLASSKTDEIQRHQSAVNMKYSSKKPEE